MNGVGLREAAAAATTATTATAATTATTATAAETAVVVQPFPSLHLSTVQNTTVTVGIGVDSALLHVSGTIPAPGASKYPGVSCNEAAQ